MPLVLREPDCAGAVVEIELDEILYQCTTPYQELLIARTKAYERMLFLDNLVQSSECDEAMYHECLVHPALLAHANPRRVLVGGTGEAASVREILKHPGVERVLTVDIDRQVVEACVEHLPYLSQGALQDPRVESRYEDIRDTLAGSPEGEFDAVFMDLTDPVEDGPAADICSVEFYREVARVMAEDAVLVVQSGELDPVDAVQTKSVVATLGKVFAWTHVLHVFMPSFHALWSFCLASNRPLAPTSEQVATRIEGLKGDLRYYSATNHGAIWQLPAFLAKLMDAQGGKRPSGG